MYMFSWKNKKNVITFQLKEMPYLELCLLQSNLVISNSLISNYRLSRSENLVPVLT